MGAEMKGGATVVRSALLYDVANTAKGKLRFISFDLARALHYPFAL